MQISRVSAQLYTNYNFGINQITSYLGHYPNIDGRGIILSIKDDFIDTSLLDFRDKIILIDSGFKSMLSSHATRMGLLTTSNGLYSSMFKGIAPEAGLHITSSSKLFSSSTNLNNYDIKLQLHPYGIGIENFYGVDASTYDAMMENDTCFLHIFSSGNSGHLSAIGGNYDSMKNWSNLTGNFKQSKNSIVVGAIDEADQLNEFSSRGPAFDGRIKPDLVAYGEKGTSDAAALISGGIILMQNLYKKLYDQFPSSSLIKSSLVASAKPIKNKILSYNYGYGKFDHLEAMRIFESRQFFIGDISNGQKRFHELKLTDSIYEIRVVLSWIDPHAKVGVSKALINDLNLKIEDDRGHIYYPYKLNQHRDSIDLDASIGIDNNNNIELIAIKSPNFGNLKLIVEGYKINTHIQKYHISYSATKMNHFEWLSQNDTLIYDNNNLTLQWKTTVSDLFEFGYIDNLGNMKKIRDVEISLNKLSFPFQETGPIMFYFAKNKIKFYSKKYFLKCIPTIKSIVNLGSQIIIQNNSDFYKSIDLKILSQGQKYFLECGLANYKNYIYFQNNKSNIFWLNYNYDNYVIESLPIYIDTISKISLLKDYYIEYSNNKIYFELNLDLNELIQKIYLKKKTLSTTVYIDSIEHQNNLFKLVDLNPSVGLNRYTIEIKTIFGSTNVNDGIIYFNVGKKKPLIYPNPISRNGCFNLKFDLPGKRIIKVLDLTGKLLGKYSSMLAETEICLANVSSKYILLQILSGLDKYTSIISVN